MNANEAIARMREHVKAMSARVAFARAQLAQEQARVDQMEGDRIDLELAIDRIERVAEEQNATTEAEAKG